MRLTDSPLWDKLTTQGFTVDPSQRLDGDLRIWTVSRSDDSRVLMQIVPAVIVGGRKEARIDASLPNWPLRFSLTLDLESVRKGTGQFALDLEHWYAKPFQFLTYFQLVSDLVDAVRGGASLMLQCDVQGNPWRTTEVPIEQLALLANLSELVEVN